MMDCHTPCPHAHGLWFPDLLRLAPSSRWADPSHTWGRSAWTRRLVWPPVCVTSCFLSVAPCRSVAGSGRGCVQCGLRALCLPSGARAHSLSQVCGQE